MFWNNLKSSKKVSYEVSENFGLTESEKQGIEANKAFGKRVKSRLLAVGMTSRELAELLNIKPQYMSQICTGKHSGIKYRRKIMEILKLDAA